MPYPLGHGANNVVSHPIITMLKISFYTKTNVFFAVLACCADVAVPRGFEPGALHFSLWAWRLSWNPCWEGPFLALFLVFSGSRGAKKLWLLSPIRARAFDIFRVLTGCATPAWGSTCGRGVLKPISW